MYRVANSRRRCVARERAAVYQPQRSPIEAAMAKIQQGLDELSAADPASYTDDEVLSAALHASAVASQLAAQETRLVGEVDRRDAYRADACVTPWGWLKLRTALGHGASKRRVARARLLERMPLLRRAYENGETRTEHVDAIVYRAKPARLDAIAEADEALTIVATGSEPRAVAVAVQRIADHVDRDGSEDPDPCEAEDLRGLHLQKGFSGLEELSGTTTAVLAELLRRIQQTYGTWDPVDTPEAQRRTASQRFHDALVAALLVALDNHPSRPGGVKVHVELFVDLFTLLGADELATIKPRFGSGKGITPELARHIVATSNPLMRAIVGLGPWLPVSVGRVRSMPEWLKAASHVGHPQCRGPGCELPAVLCDEDHNDEYCKGGVTAAFNGTPMCRPHNNLKHNDGWTVRFDTSNGEVTWTSSDGRRAVTLPPPDI